MAKKLPPKWLDVYPAGTKVGDEECKFFKALNRHKKYTWRSVDAIRKESGLTAERVEQIIDKYRRKGLVFQNPQNEDQWGYWERNLDQVPDVPQSIARVDQNKRIDKIIKSEESLEWKSLTAQQIRDAFSLSEKSDGPLASDKDMAYFREKLFNPLVFPPINLDMPDDDISCTVHVSCPDDSPFDFSGNAPYKGDLKFKSSGYGCSLVDDQNIQANKQLKLLEDAMVVYHLIRP